MNLKLKFRRTKLARQSRPSNSFSPTMTPTRHSLLKSCDNYFALEAIVIEALHKVFNIWSCWGPFSTVCFFSFRSFSRSVLREPYFTNRFISLSGRKLQLLSSKYISCRQENFIISKFNTMSENIPPSKTYSWDTASKISRTKKFRCLLCQLFSISTKKPPIWTMPPSYMNNVHQDTQEEGATTCCF
jgi:hypothetical protein